MSSTVFVMNIALSWLAVIEALGGTLVAMTVSSSMWDPIWQENLKTKCLTWRMRGA